MKPRILVVDDDAALAEMLTIVLRGEGFEPFVVGDGTQALTAVREIRPDLVLLDLMLPGMNGIDVCRVLRADSGVPIVMLTAKTDTVDVVLGLESGADDYIMKPFKPKELVARIKAVMRRISPMAVEEVIEMQGLSLDPSSHRVMANDQPLDMGPTEFKLLHFFMTHPERVYSREQLLNHVWGTNVYVEDRTVDVHIRRLRKALETSGHDKMVQTVRGTGYRFSTRY